MYEWVKVIHILAVISWMAGLLYLPRLFVYHSQVAAGSEASEKFKVMERKLLRGIMNPAMIVSWVFGLWTAHEIGAWDQGWFHGKMALVILMTASHMVYARHRKTFERDANDHSERYYRIVNEAPAVLMIGIVILVVVKPF